MTSYLQPLKHQLENISSHYHTLSVKKKIALGVAIASFACFASYITSKQNLNPLPTLRARKVNISDTIEYIFAHTVSNLFYLIHYASETLASYPDIKELFTAPTTYCSLIALGTPKKEAIRSILPSLLRLLRLFFISKNKFSIKNHLSDPPHPVQTNESTRLLEKTRVQHLLDNGNFMVVLTGEPGVGKSTLLNQIAFELKEQNITVHRLNLDTFRSPLLCPHLSLFERLSLLNSFSYIYSILHLPHKNRTCKTVYILDELSSLNRPSEGSSSLASNLRLYYEYSLKGNCAAFQILAATTTSELDSLYNKDPALKKMLSVIEISPLREKEVKLILTQKYSEKKRNDIQDVIERLKLCKYPSASIHSEADHMMSLSHRFSNPIGEILDIYHPLPT